MKIFHCLIGLALLSASINIAQGSPLTPTTQENLQATSNTKEAQDPATQAAPSSAAAPTSAPTETQAVASTADQTAPADTVPAIDDMQELKLPDDMIVDIPSDVLAKFEKEPTLTEKLKWAWAFLCLEATLAYDKTEAATSYAFDAVTIHLYKHKKAYIIGSICVGGAIVGLWLYKSRK